MKSKQRNICSYKLRGVINNFFVRYGKIIIILALFSVLSILIGSFTAAKYAGKLEINNLSNETFINFIKGDSNSWALYFKYLFHFLLLCIVAIFLNIKPFCIVFNIAVLCIYSYISAFDIVVFILLFSMSGIIYSILILIPFFVAILFAYILISAVAIYDNIYSNKFGRNCVKGVHSFKFYAYMITFVAIILLLECMILPIIRSTIIVN